MISGFNKNVACKPVESRAPEKTSVGKGDKVFNVLASRSKLVPLTVVFGSEEHDIETGDRLYLTHAEAAALKLLDVETDKGMASVVIVSLDSVQLVDRRRDDGADLMRGYRTPPGR